MRNQSVMLDMELPVEVKYNHVVGGAPPSLSDPGELADFDDVGIYIGDVEITNQITEKYKQEILELALEEI